MATQIMKIGGLCVVTATLYDPKKATTEKSADAEGKCGERALMLAIKRAVGKLANTRRRATTSHRRPPRSSGPRRGGRRVGHTKATRRPAKLTPRQRAQRRPLGSQAIRAYLGNEWSRAVELGQQYLAAYPTDQRVLGAVGAAACQAGRAALAKRIYRRLSRARRNTLATVCKRSKIVVR